MIDNKKYITVSEEKFKELENLANLASSKEVRVTIEDRTHFPGPYYSDSIPGYNMHFFSYKHIEANTQATVPSPIGNAIKENDINVRLIEIRASELKELIQEQTKSLIKLNDERRNADSKLYLIPMWIRKIFGAT